MSDYLAAANAAWAERREKGSRFLAHVEPTGSADEAAQQIEAWRRKYRDATHHCWAWRLGWPPSERSSDDGEPSGTAGMPILQACRGSGLSDLSVVVVRWYGGTKLGKGGLARAYAGTAVDALGEVEGRRLEPTKRLVVELSFEQLGAVKRWIRPPAICLATESYGDRVRLEIDVTDAAERSFLDGLADLGLHPLDSRSGP